MANVKFNIAVVCFKNLFYFFLVMLVFLQSSHIKHWSIVQCRVTAISFLKVDPPLLQRGALVIM